MSLEEKQELVKYRFEKARETLIEVEIQIENKLWNVAVNRLYYACFYAVSALLADKDIYSKTHSGTRQMFGLHFVKTGIIDGALSEFYTTIFDMRHRGDYDDFVDYERYDVEGLIEPARELISAIEQALFKK